MQQLMEAVGLVASALPSTRRQACVQQMLDMVAQPLQALLHGGEGVGQQQQMTTSMDESLPLVMPLVDRMTTIFRSVRDPEDVAQALVRLWPWIETALCECCPRLR